ncbi:MAG: sulfite reductase subunit beta, partial [Ferruginibacter sp.]
RADRYGWLQNAQGVWYYTLFVENGRVLDDEKLALKTALLEVAKTGSCNFLFTSNQNMIISDVADKDKGAINEILERFKIIEHTEAASHLRKNSIACVALPTCPLALAEGQRYLPTLISKIEPLVVKYQLQDEGIIMRMTGCPNGCGRPYAAEIGFVGTAVGRYNLHIGGDNEGERLNTLYKESLDEAGLIAELDILFAAFKKERKGKENFGDFSHRKYVLKN